MSLAVFNSASFISAAGLAVAAGATIEVRRESDGLLASIFSDAAGAVPITNPSAFADASGRFTFYAAGILGGYSVKVTKGAENFTIHNVAIGVLGQLDVAYLDAQIPDSVIDAKGDLIVGTAADVPGRLPVGAAGSVPMARPADAFGLAYVAALTKAIYGLTYANNVADATNDIDIAAGGAMDATGAYWMTCAALTKRLDANWAVGNNQGGLDTGSIGNSDYYIWLIARSDTGVVDYLFSLSSTAPTMPANYDFKRLIGWFKRVSATIVPFKTFETEGGGIQFAWTTTTQDVNLSATLTTTRRTDALKVPLNFSVIADLSVYVADAASSYDIFLGCPDVADVSPNGAANTTRIIGQLNVANLSYHKIRTSSTGTIAARADLATVDTYAVSTLGFIWARRN